MQGTGWPPSEKTGTGCACLEKPTRTFHDEGYEQQLARTGPWCLQSRNLSKDIPGQVLYHTESRIPAIISTAWCDGKIN